MKIKILPILIFAALVALTGCKPKETTLSGQVFIVTKGAENVKLGDVEILLIEKSQVTDFLQKKQPAIELGMASKREDLTNAEQEVATALINANKAQAYLDWFTANKLYKTNADYIKVSSEWDNLFKQYVRQTNYVEEIAATTKNLQDTATYANANLVAAVNSFEAALNERDKMAEKLNLLNDQKKSIKMDALAAEAGKLESIKSKVMEANSDAAMAKKNLDNSPTVENYFEDFSPTGIQKTISDSDGKFSFSCSRDKPLTIFVRAKRAVLDKTETYCWLIDAPIGKTAAQILLSNNNLVFADPDGYFKLKPKEFTEASSAQ